MTGLPFADAIRILKESRVPLIIIPRSPSTDALAAGLALTQSLERAGKSPHLVSQDFRLPDKHNFLPKSETVKNNLSSLRSFIINVNTKKTKLDTLSYDLEGDQLRIYVTPKSGTFEAQDVTTSSGPYAYDTAIVIGATSLNELGEIYEQNAEFFYKTPLISIDHRPQHARFGQINLVDVVASSSSEIVFELIQQFAPDTLDEHIATSVLTGIISNTQGFQSQTVTPRALSIASQLISVGARRDVIIQNLFQTKTVSTLRLWGRALANIQSSPDQRVIWTSVTQEDLKKTNTKPADALGLLHDLMQNTPNAAVASIFIEQNGDVEVALHTQTANELTLPEGIVRETPTDYHGRIRGPLRTVRPAVLNTLGIPAT